MSDHIGGSVDGEIARLPVMPGVMQVKKRKIPGVLKGDPWVYPNAVVTMPEAYGVVRVELDDGTFIGWADCNPSAPIPARILSRYEDWPGEEELLHQRVVAALSRRLQLGYHLQAGACRIVNGEGDGLPGLVIDVFGRTIVVDFYSRCMRDRQPLIAAIFAEHLGDYQVVWRMGPDAAKREGCEPLTPEAGELVFTENGVTYRLPVEESQKTGFYLDQRDNRRLVTTWANGSRVLDLFCYQGAFSLECLAAGAAEALAVDSSASALAAATNHAAANGLPLETLETDVFDWLDQAIETPRWDLVICDPPKLAPRTRDRQKALSAYRYLIDRSLRCVEGAGVLLVSSCSQAIGNDDLRTLLSQICARHRIEADVVAMTAQPADHPWPIGFPTGRYLSSIAVSVRGD